MQRVFARVGGCQRERRVLYHVNFECDTSRILNNAHSRRGRCGCVRGVLAGESSHSRAHDRGKLKALRTEIMPGLYVAARGVVHCVEACSRATQFFARIFIFTVENKSSHILAHCMLCTKIVYAEEALLRARLRTSRVVRGDSMYFVLYLVRSPKF